MTTRPPLDAGVFGESAVIRASSRFCAAPVKSTSDDFIGILFGPENILSIEDRKGVVDRLLDGRPASDRDPEGSALCSFGWVVKYSVNPTVATLSGPTNGAGQWSFVRSTFPPSDPKDLYRLLMNYGYKFNQAADEGAFKGGSGSLDRAKAGSFDVLFYSCDFGSPLSK